MFSNKCQRVKNRKLFEERGGGERERERESREEMTDTMLGRRRGQETISPVMKVPAQCLLVLLVKVMHIIAINFDDDERATCSILAFGELH
jgi:hypothetical protein